MPRLLLIAALLVVGCSRPSDVPSTPPPVEQPVSAPTPRPEPAPVEPVEPEAPRASPELFSDLQDRVHRLLDRSLGVALTMNSYSYRPDPVKVGSARWVGAAAQFEVGGTTLATITPRDLPCDVTNDGSWRRAWVGRGAATGFNVVPQWWILSMSGPDAYIRVGATNLTAMVFDASRKCWTGASILEPPRRPVSLKSLGPSTGTMGPGQGELDLFGSVGKISVSPKKISFFDGKNRISFDSSDKRRCVWVEWGKTDDGYWVWARFSSGAQEKGCPEDVDVATEEFVEIRDANGELVRALRDTAPGDRAPVGRRTHFVRQNLGATVVTWEATEEHGVVEPSKEWIARCKAVHRDNLREPVVPVASRQAFVGVWTVQRDGKEVASGVGRQVIKEYDCVPTED